MIFAPDSIRAISSRRSSAVNPANGQLPSRGDFSAQVMHYRMRGADEARMERARDKMLSITRGWEQARVTGAADVRISG